MKHSAAAFLVLAGILLSCDDVQPAKVPAEVRQALVNTFPSATYIQWERKRADYKADFDVSATNYSALFSASGSILQHKHVISESDLPERVRITISRSFTGYSIVQAEHYVRSGAILYQVKLKNGSKKAKVVLTADGQQSQHPYWE